MTRFFQTLRHLRPVQIAGRLWFLMWRPRPDRRPAPPLRACGPWTESPAPPRSLTGPHTLSVLGETHDIAGPDAWQHAPASKLWRYNLHYFDDLDAEWYDALVRRWIDENPPARGIGWDPYPTSLRIVNWSKRLLRGAPADAVVIQSLAVQARWLRRRIEHHLSGNHLVANAKALVFAGFLFDGAEADAWRRAGITLLERELREQVLPDGGHYELSPMYHLLVLEDLLDLINLHRACGERAPQPLHDAAAAMARWSAVMRHPDGEIPFFNDAAFGIAHPPAALDAYAARLGLEPAPPIRQFEWLRHSGYARGTVGPATLFVDVAAVGPDHQPGHAHADTLSFELSLGGRRVVVNGGTSVYGTGSERQRQRGTAAHATAVVDGRNSSDVWHGFRVGRRARIVDAGAGAERDAFIAHGAHDGYSGVVHTRSWRLDADRVTVTDSFTGRRPRTVDLMFPLGPGLSARVDDGRAHIVDAGGEPVATVHAVDAELFAESCTWHPRFGVTEPAMRVRVRSGSEQRTVIAWA